MSHPTDCLMTSCRLGTHIEPDMRMIAIISDTAHVERRDNCTPRFHTVPSLPHVVTHQRSRSNGRSFARISSHGGINTYRMVEIFYHLSFFPNLCEFIFFLERSNLTEHHRVQTTSPSTPSKDFANGIVSRIQRGAKKERRRRALVAAGGG